MVLPSLTSLITDAGDAGLLLPMAVVGVGMLWLYQSWAIAWLLLRSVLAAGAVIVVLKLLFLSCAAHWVPGLASPSGHACLSAVVYGTLGTVLAAGRPRRVQWLIAALAAVFIAAIAITRLTLGVHTPVEVVLGLAVGGLAQWWFVRAYAHAQPRRVDLRVFGVGLAATLVLAFGVRLPAESLIRHMARRLAANCVGAAAQRAALLADAGAAAPQPARSSVARSSASARAVSS